MTARRDADPAARADVAEVQQLARDLEAGDPTYEHYTTDGSDAVLWAVVLVCILVALVACVLAVVVVQIVRHWLGAIELGLGAFIIHGLFGKGRSE